MKRKEAEELRVELVAMMTRLETLFRESLTREVIRRKPPKWTTQSEDLYAITVCVDQAAVDGVSCAVFEDDDGCRFPVYSYVPELTRALRRSIGKLRLFGYLCVTRDEAGRPISASFPLDSGRDR